MKKISLSHLVLLQLISDYLLHLGMVYSRRDQNIGIPGVVCGIVEEVGGTGFSAVHLLQPLEASTDLIGRV